MHEIIRGKIIDADTDGLIIRIPFNDWDKLARQHSSDALVQIADGRHMTAQQNRFIWQMMTAIGTQYGYRDCEIYSAIYEKRFLSRFRSAILPNLRDHALRLSNATQEEAQTVINLLIDFCITNDIQMDRPLSQYTEDIGYYVYSCVMSKRCSVCGKKSDLHHVDAVGMGRDRNQICHIGMNCLPLCRQHHTQAHSIGNESFMQKYHLQPVKINQEIATKYKLGGK